MDIDDKNMEAMSCAIMKSLLVLVALALRSNICSHNGPNSAVYVPTKS